MNVTEVIEDLIAEQDALDEVVSRLTDEQWGLPTPSPRWAVTDQIGHLTYFDRDAAIAITDPIAYTVRRDLLMSKFTDNEAVDDATLGDFRTLSPPEQLAAWRQARSELEAAARTLDDSSRVEWYGPSMGARSFITARLMEVWAHGTDVCDTVGAQRTPSDRLRHIAQLGVITRGWSYAVRGQTAPRRGHPRRARRTVGNDLGMGRRECSRPDSGPRRGLLPRRHAAPPPRRHRAHRHRPTHANEWMRQAQAFAGAPTDGPDARSSGAPPDGLRPAPRRRSPPSRHQALARGAPRPDERRPPRRRLHRSSLAPPVRPRRRPDAPADHRRRTPTRRRREEPRRPRTRSVSAGPLPRSSSPDRIGRRIASSRRSSPARRSGASCSPSRTRGPTSPAWRPERCETATSTSSTARRSGRRAPIIHSSASSSHAPTRMCRSTRASPISSCRWDLPGVELRPIVDMTTAHSFNQTFFTDVRLPAEYLVGQEGDGWRLAKVTLANERVSLSSAGSLVGHRPVGQRPARPRPSKRRRPRPPGPPARRPAPTSKPRSSGSAGCAA